jgi:hypothetical protein
MSNYVYWADTGELDSWTPEHDHPDGPEHNHRLFITDKQATAMGKVVVRDLPSINDPIRDAFGEVVKLRQWSAEKRTVIEVDPPAPRMPGHQFMALLFDAEFEKFEAVTDPVAKRFWVMAKANVSIDLNTPRNRDVVLSVLDEARALGILAGHAKPVT